MDQEKPTVLVVEDEESLVEIYVHWLQGRYEVLTADSGDEALDAVSDAVDVALLDRLMPGMTGEEVLEAFRERGIGCRVAMVTAVEPDFDILAMGFDDYLTKPVDREELLSTVDRLAARETFARQERELYSLAAKRAALVTTKAGTELDDNEEFTDLEARIADLRGDLDASLSEMDDEEFVSMVRDLEDDGDRWGGGE